MSKKFLWPQPLADKVLLLLIQWYKTYESGMITKSKTTMPQSPVHDFKGTKIMETAHRVPFTYNQIKWLSDTISTEDNQNRQALFFKLALERFNDKKVPFNAVHYLSLALPKEDLEWVIQLLQTIRSGKQTPSERKQAQEAIEKGDW